MMSRTLAKYSLAPIVPTGRPAHHALAVIAAVTRWAAMLTCAISSGSVTSANAAEIVAPFVHRVYENPAPNDALLTAIHGPGWYAKDLELHRRLHLSGSLKALVLTASIPAPAIVVYLDDALGVCEHDFGEVHDLIPRIQSCPAKMLIKSGGGWTSRNIGAVCAIYNGDDAGSGDKSFAAYDPTKKQLRFWAVLQGKHQPECDRTVALTP